MNVESLNGRYYERRNLLRKLIFTLTAAIAVTGCKTTPSPSVYNPEDHKNKSCVYNAWHVSESGTQSWSPLATSDYELENYRFGDFVGDSKTDVFTASLVDNSIVITGNSTNMLLESLAKTAAKVDWVNKTGVLTTQAFADQMICGKIYGPNETTFYSCNFTARYCEP